MLVVSGTTCVALSSSSPSCDSLASAARGRAQPLKLASGVQKVSKVPMVTESVVSKPVFCEDFEII